MGNKPEPYTNEELETLRNGSQYQTRQNARWFATLDRCRKTLALIEEDNATLRAQADPFVMQAASFAVHGALGWGFDPNTVSPASLARAAESLAQEFMTMRARAEKAEAERDTLRAQVEALEADQHCPTCGSSVYTCVDCDVAPLRAQVEAARAMCAKVVEADYTTIGETGVARGVLRAMDRAKP